MVRCRSKPCLVVGSQLLGVQPPAPLCTRVKNCLKLLHLSRLWPMRRCCIVMRMGSSVTRCSSLRQFFSLVHHGAVLHKVLQASPPQRGQPQKPCACGYNSGWPSHGAPEPGRGLREAKFHHATPVVIHGQTLTATPVKDRCDTDS
jgi:hypothetical protein